MRILIYSQDSLGLGHLRRTNLIARELLAARPEANVLLITDSPAGPFFALPERMDHLKLPSIRKVSAGVWKSTRLNIAQPELTGWRADAVRNTAKHWQPDLLLADHMPGGALGELLPTLEFLRQHRPACRLAIGLRDILDAEAVTRRTWQEEGAYEAVRNYYDRLLVYGVRSVFDTTRTYGIPAPRFGVEFCGYVVNRATPAPVAFGRAKDNGSQKWVYVSAGGGGDSELLMRRYVEAIRQLGNRADFWSLVAVGINAPAGLHEEISRMALGLPIRVVTHVTDGLGTMAAADLVVCMAGYNTIAEVIRLSKRAIVVPRSGPSAEQRMRSRMLKDRGIVEMVDPNDLTAEHLGERLVAGLRSPDFPCSKPDFDTDGARRAAASLLDLMESEQYARAV